MIPIREPNRAAVQAPASICPSIATLITADRSHITPHSAPRISGTASAIVLLSRPTTSTKANELAEASQQIRATTDRKRPAPMTGPNQRRRGAASQTTPSSTVDDAADPGHRDGGQVEGRNVLGVEGAEPERGVLVVVAVDARSARS